MNGFAVIYFSVVGALGLTLVLDALRPRCGCRRRARWTFGPVLQKRQSMREEPQMTGRISNEQKVLMTLNVQSEGQHPAALDGPPVWTSSDETKCTVAPEPDGLSAWAISVDGAEGVSTITVRGDADRTSGVREIIDAVDMEVVLPEAMSLGLSIGAPVLK